MTDATKKKVIILGGTGLLGQHAARELTAQGHEVTLAAIDAPELLPGIDVEPTIVDLFGSPDDDVVELLRGHDSLIYALGPDDRVIHLAPADAFFQTKLVQATERIVTLAREAGITKVAICGSYFATWSRMTEGHGFPDRHPYVRARLDQARRAVAAGGGQADGGADVCIVEIPYVFGTLPGVMPMWRDVLFDRLSGKGPTMYPSGGTSVVTATQVGQALAGAALVGEHDARYPLADLQMTWNELLGVVLPMLGKSARVINVPRKLAEFESRKMDAEIKAEGKESGLDPLWLMRDIMYNRMFVDPSLGLRHLGWKRGGVHDAIRETVVASYPEGLPNRA